MHHTNEDHTANAKRSCVAFATRGIPDKESSAGGLVVLDASGSMTDSERRSNHKHAFEKMSYFASQHCCNLRQT
jgi:hypothetical protein